MARRQKTAAETADDKSKESTRSEGSGPHAKAEVAKNESAKAETNTEAAKSAAGGSSAKAESKPAEPAGAATPAQPARPARQDLPEIDPPAPRDEPWPDATPQPMRPVQPAARAATEPEPAPSVSRTATVAMPVAADPGKPPEMPQSVAPPPLAVGSVEDPTHMPGPKDVPAGNPDDPAPAPGRVPPGDSRSLRRGADFALIYRVGTCVITRTGVVGTRGQWRVVEYPTSAAASNSYAKECSRFVSDGFSDYRE